MNNFRDNLIKFRRKSIYTQQELANRIGVSQKNVGSYEEGRAIPKLDVLIKIADTFKISIDQLIR